MSVYMLPGRVDLARILEGPGQRVVDLEEDEDTRELLLSTTITHLLHILHIQNKIRLLHQGGRY